MEERRRYATSGGGAVRRDLAEGGPECQPPGPGGDAATEPGFAAPSGPDGPETTFLEPTEADGSIPPSPGPPVEEPPPTEGGRPDDGPDATEVFVPGSTAALPDGTEPGATDPDATEGPGGPGPAQPSAAGVPGYEILGVLGQGGMGVVYRARQIRLNRLVALKMIRGGRAGDVQLERFRIETEAVAHLRHPNVVQIYDVGEAGGLPFCALELLEGGTLAQRLAGTPRPAREAAELAAALARAVHAAHQAGIVHRDLKPSNVLFDRDGTPKVTDFGLAKRIEDDSGHTATGQVLGTPSYMAPEQARGQNAAVGPPADVYALGAVLYEMLTGRPPHRGTTPMETVLMVIDREPVPPSRLQVRVPRDLETICLTSLRKEPARRYASAEALAEDLGRFLAGEPIRARPTPAWERGLKWARRHPSTALLSVLAATAALALLAETIRHREASLREDRRVAAAGLAALDSLGRAQGQAARGELDDALATLAGLQGKLQAEPRLAAERGRAEALLAGVRRGLADRSAGEAARAARQAARASFERFLGLRDEAIFRDIPFTGLGASDTPGAARESARAALAVFGPGGADVLGALTKSEQDDVAAGSYQVTLILAEATARPLPGEDPARQAREALTILDRLAATRSPDKAYFLRRATCLDRLGDARAARAARDRAATFPPGDPSTRVMVGQELCRRGDWSAAAGEFDAALQAQPNLFWAQCLAAICYLNARPARPAEAKAALTACLQQRPGTPWLYLLRGHAYGEMGALTRGVADRLPDQAAALKAQAEAQFEAAEADDRRALDSGLEGDLRYALFMNRGVLRFRRDRPEEAAADFREAVALAPGRYNAYASLAQALAEAGRPAEAIGQLDLAIARDPGRASLYRDRAAIRLGPGDPPPAALDAALADLAEAARREPPGTRAAASDHARRGQLLIRAGRPADALEAGDAALAIAPDLPAAQLVRAAALLERKEYEEVIRTCAAATASGPPSPELLELRALARVGRGDFAGAVEDDTAALAARPARPARLHAYRGAAYLLANSPELALRDYERVSQLDPADPDGPAGRGAALVGLRRPREAVAAAEASLRLGEPSAKTLYRAARTFAQAAAQLAPAPSRGDARAARDALIYESRALVLLRRALEATPADRRAAFRRDVLAADDAFALLRRRPQFARLAGRTPAAPPAPARSVSP